MNEFNRRRPPLWPTARAILLECDLETDRQGWVVILGWCRLLHPAPKLGIPYPTLYGPYDLDRIQYVPLRGRIGNTHRSGVGYEETAG